MPRGSCARGPRESPPGTIQIYCLEHLAAASKVSSGHLADLAVFVRSLREHGAYQTCYEGIWDTDAHDTDRVLIWESLLSDTVPPDDNPPATSRRRDQTPVKAGGAAVSSPVRRS